MRIIVGAGNVFAVFLVESRRGSRIAAARGSEGKHHVIRLYGGKGIAYHVGVGIDRFVFQTGNEVGGGVNDLPFHTVGAHKDVKALDIHERCGVVKGKGADRFGAVELIPEAAEVFAVRALDPVRQIPVREREIIVHFGF